MGTLSEVATLLFSFFPTFTKGSTLKGKNLLPVKPSVSFNPTALRVLAILSAIGLEVNPFWEGFLHPGEQTVNHKSCPSPLQKWLENMVLYPHTSSVARPNRHTMVSPGEPVDILFSKNNQFIDIKR